jgi:hypothetical protein
VPATTTTSATPTATLTRVPSLTPQNRLTAFAIQTQQAAP